MTDTPGHPARPPTATPGEAHQPDHHPTRPPRRSQPRAPQADSPPARRPLTSPAPSEMTQRGIRSVRLPLGPSASFWRVVRCRSRDTGRSRESGAWTDTYRRIRRALTACAHVPICRFSLHAPRSSASSTAVIRCTSGRAFPNETRRNGERFLDGVSASRCEARMPTIGRNGIAIRDELESFVLISLSPPRTAPHRRAGWQE